MIKFFIILAFIYWFYSAIRVYYLIQRGRAVAAVAQKFERIKSGAKMRILVAGDSTAVGTGARIPEESVAGQFSSMYSKAEIVNVSQNGLRVHDLKAHLIKNDLGNFDLILFMIGGNDITHFTPLIQIRQSLTVLFEWAHKQSKRIGIVHSGNLGAAPIFPYLIGKIYTHRTRMIRTLYRELSKKNDVAYIDLFAERVDDIFLRDIKKYYLSDQFHPSSDGYAVWFQKIVSTLRAENKLP